jgi:hypothetical protein
MTHQEVQLRGDIRQALENYMGDEVWGPWDDIIEEIAAAIEGEGLSATSAARLDLLLRRTGRDGHTDCPVCTCPCPGLSH